MRAKGTYRVKRITTTHRGQDGCAFKNVLADHVGTRTRGESRYFVLQYVVSQFPVGGWLAGAGGTNETRVGLRT